MAYLNHSLPDWNCYIRNEFLYNHKQGHGEVTKCDVHSVASMEKRVPLFEAFLENGVNWTRRPLHAFCWKPDAEIEPLETTMYWDCFSPYVDVNRRNRLAGLFAELIRPDNTKVEGEYMFTLDWGWENKGIPDLNYSETPEHKCAHLFKVETGNYYAYPNNRIIWYDNAWTLNRIQENPGFEIDTTLYSVENKRRIETSDHYMYDVTSFEEYTSDEDQDMQDALDHVEQMQNTTRPREQSIPPAAFAGNYEGPLYAPHPDLNNE